MKTKVLLVYPEIPTTYWSFKYSLSFLNKKSSMPPLGLLTVAALMPEHYELKLLDMNVTDLTREAIENADIVFASAMLVQKDSMRKVINMCMECGTPLAAGGPYPTSSYKDIEGVDYFILNEAEITLPEFIKDYDNGTAKKIYTSDIKPDLAETPVPRFDLLENMADYGSMALQYSRGCPFNCEFCDIIEMFGRTPRTKTPGQFIEEMEHLYNTGFRGSLFIVDDNFIGNKAKVKELLREIIRWQNKNKFPFNIFTEASINLAQDDELLDLMVKAGFRYVFVGIETPDTNTLASMQKKQNLKEDILENVIKIQSRGLEVLGGFIVGFDTDPEDIFERQIRFIQEAGIPLAMIGLLTAISNTQLYRRLEAEGRILGASSGNNTHNFELNFIPKMPADKLVNGYKQIISEIYKPKNYFERCWTLISRLPKKKTLNKRIELIFIKAFFLSLFKQSFSKYGFIYLKFLLKVLFKKPSFFVPAVIQAVKGYHFFKITEEILQAEAFSTMLDVYMEHLMNEISEIMAKGNALIASKMEEYKTDLKHKTGKRYKRMNYNMQVYLNERLNKFDLYCDSIISQWKDKLSLQNKSEDNN
ncbi:MAG: B12-binding domain-containing radical SAM protein [Spirochaetes bacterium]|nr:B12-binding domain-containing radical SAM protein [Spirochaetota bacterium]